MADLLFEVDGERLEIPMPETLSFDEWEFAYELTGYRMRDFAPPDPDAPEEEIAAQADRTDEASQSPKLQRVLVSIAYVRAHPETALAEIYARLGSMPLVDVFTMDVETEEPELDSEGEPSPPDEEGSTSEPNESSSEETGDSLENSPIESPITSATPEEPLESIGVTR